MLVLAEDLLGHLAKSLFQVVSREAAKKAVKGTLPPVQLEEVGAFIDSLFGDEFSTFSIMIREHLENAVQEISAEMREEIIRQAAQSEYREILQKLHGIGEKCRTYQMHRESSTAQDEFIKICEKDCASNILSWLDFRLTNPNHTVGDFLENICRVCNYTQFLEWRDHLNAIAGLACFYRTILLDLKLWKLQANGLKIDKELEIAAEEFVKMKAWVDHIKIFLDRKCTEKKGDFLRPCRDPKHRHCGGKQQEYCTILSETMFKFLKESKDKSPAANSDIAAKLTMYLKEMYPWYEWAALINNSGSITEDFFFHRDFDRSRFDELRVQYLSEKERPWAIFVPDKFQVAGIMSKGSLYGQMTCHYTSAFSTQTRVAQVFWADEEQVRLVSGLKAHLLTKLETLEHPSFYTKETLTGFQSRLKEILMHDGYAYTFVQTALKRTASADTLGINLVQRDEKTWPLHLEDKNGHTFLWPRVFANPRSPEGSGLDSAMVKRTCIIVAGGLNKNDKPCSTVEYYDSERAVWADLKCNMPYSVSHAGATDMDDIMYVVGGHNGESILDSTLRFVFARGQWNSDVPKLKQARWNHSVVECHRAVYALGGLNRSGDSLKTVEMWDPRVDKWASVAPMRTARANLAAVSTGDNIFAICGMKSNGSVIETAERFDPRINRWEDMPGPSTSRADHSCAYIGSDIYLIGGWQVHGSGRRTQSSCERYNVSTKKWTPVPGMKHPRDGLATVVSKSGELFVLGGRSHTTGAIDSVEQYDSHNRSWKEASSMKMPRQFHVASSTPVVSEGQHLADFII